ncbi:hypothetical protein [Clostridium aminobutyricum]|uniref:Uncharacterized protein n=1 Tax=Clostridium aminobutyricum TaxID=33953 RepID=A0A939IHM5_CLOAM|nr:hypothetical protein [Clostridium aminobutyricum]MBN7772166.1 hypothetical protein [Clostridium aminobutyricum]
MNATIEYSVVFLHQACLARQNGQQRAERIGAAGVAARKCSLNQPVTRLVWYNECNY